MMKAAPGMIVVTDEINLITVFLLVIFFVIKIALFTLLWKTFFVKIVELQQDLRKMAAGSMQVAGQMRDTKDKILRAESLFKNLEARLDHHLLQCNGVDEKST